MSAATLITGLYPPAVRQRWGTEISREVAEAGIRCWPDAVAGAARLWLHPSDWPGTLTGQTRRVLAVALFAVAAVTALLLRATQPSTTLTADPGHPATSLWLLPILLGIGLGTPLPVPRRQALAHLTTVSVRTLAAPAAALSAMVLAANSGVVEQPTGFVRVALVGCYWAVLTFTALRLCSLVARVAPAAAMPTTRRLCAALLLIGAGLALATGQSLFAVVWTAPTAGSLAATLALGLLTTATIRAGHDLRPGRTPAASRPR
ncbi:hypothetical protein ACFOY4_10060 [Actinomadura syzygii]|uniref:Uncharacterized protein n=1 Tax=Actinomadura syzygii TaxID=1427538 RepID=A0A5D0UDV9_9ACTN|nr:hypothetical protein [Actinomadura syzygii]TYC15842.1 hypothetical protein FXF65_10900 [Actinomadura syzygii]